MDNNEPIKRNNWKFVVRIIFYIILIALLVVTLLRAGGDPCDRCRLQIDQLGDESYTCREVIETFVLPNYLVKGNNTVKDYDMGYLNNLTVGS